MSPTVLRQSGYRVMIYLNDHPPAHIHVMKADKDARGRLEPVELLHNYGFSARECADIVAMVTESQVSLLAEWDRIHPER